MFALLECSLFCGHPTCRLILSTFAEMFVDPPLDFTEIRGLQRVIEFCCEKIAIPEFRFSPVFIFAVFFDCPSAAMSRGDGDNFRPSCFLFFVGRHFSKRTCRFFIKTLNQYIILGDKPELNANVENYRRTSRCRTLRSVLPSGSSRPGGRRAQAPRRGRSGRRRP